MGYNSIFFYWDGNRDFFYFFVRRILSFILHDERKVYFSKRDVLAVIFIAYCFALLS